MCTLNCTDFCLNDVSDVWYKFLSTFTHAFFSHFGDTKDRPFHFGAPNEKGLNDKWTLNERLTNGERKVNTFLSAKWAHDERFVSGKRERSGTESA